MVIWIILILLFIWGSIDTSESSGSTRSSRTYNDNTSDEEWIHYYADGTRRVRNITDTGYCYDNGVTSYEDMLGVEHRSDGTTARENLVGWKEIYSEDGTYLGYEYDDSFGITHRVMK